MARYLTEEEKNWILDFLKPREYIPKCIEEPIYNKIYSNLKNQLSKVLVHPKIIFKLKEEITKQYFSSLIIPGESVGIICAQSIGEFSTQATLNTFHAAGLKTGVKVNNSVSKFQELINASKNRNLKTESLEIYFKNRFTLREIRSLPIVEVFLKDVVKSTLLVNDCKFLKLFNKLYGGKINKSYNYCVKFILNLDLLCKFKIEIADIKKSIENTFAYYCVYGGNLLYIYGEEDIENFTHVLLQHKLQGIENIKNCFYHKTDDEEWYITTTGGSIKSLIKSSIVNLIDFTRTTSFFVWDILEFLGIEAVRKFYRIEMKKIMDTVDECHINLLIDYMTHTSNIKAINRYTMRGEQNTFNKIAFEEPFETVIRAAEFNKGENFNGVSASVIFGKKPRIGTYSCDLLIDTEKLINNSDLIYLN